MKICGLTFKIREEMKFKNTYLVIILAFGIWSCEADPDEGLPSFDNSLPLYVQLDNDSEITAEEGEEVAITVEVPEVIYSDVNVQWELTGDITNSGTAVIIEGDLNVDVMVTIPDDGSNTEGGTATFTLIQVDNGLSLGRPNASSSIVTTTLVWTDND